MIRTQWMIAMWFVSLMVAPSLAQTPPRNTTPADERPSPTPRANNDQEAPIELKIFHLQYVKAKDAESTVEQLFRGDLFSVAADQRTNSLLVRGNPNLLVMIEALLKQLDTATTHENRDQATAATPGSVQGWPIPHEVPGLNAAEGGEPPSADTLRQQFQQLESRCLQLARQIRNDPSGRRDEALRKAVADAFQVRQQLQRAELAAFHQRLRDISQSIEMRERIADQIVSRRVDDLLNPNLKWDLSTEAAATPGAPDPTRGTGAVTTRSLADRIENAVIQREKAWGQLQGNWVLVRENAAGIKALTIRDSEVQLYDAATESIQTGVIRLRSPDKGMFEIEFGSRFARWMGTFVATDEQLTIHFTSAMQVGSRENGATEDTLLQWSGVYRPASGASIPAMGQPQNHDLIQALQPILAILRGAPESAETRLARAGLEDEWMDDIDQVLACPAHGSLQIEALLADATMAFATTNALKNERRRQMVVELALQRQIDGPWRLVLVDIDSAEDADRAMASFREEHPDARVVPVKAAIQRPVDRVTPVPGGSERNAKSEN